MSEHDIVLEWLQIAYDDYDTALYLFENKLPKPLEIICYHCQQEAEKSLKAFMCMNNIDIPKIHDVGLLCSRCAELDGEFLQFQEICDEIEVYAKQTRYPSRIEAEDLNAKAALQQAFTIYNFVKDKL